jgi:predicted ArsR family transcriptional regulator
MNNHLPNLDPLLHQPARTLLMAYLSGRGEATFSELKRVLEVTDGNLGAHLSKLMEAGYLTSSTTTGSGRTNKIYSLDPTGRTALAEYVTQLSTVVDLSTEDGKSVRDIIATQGAS